MCVDDLTLGMSIPSEKRSNFQRATRAEVTAASVELATLAEPTDDLRPGPPLGAPFWEEQGGDDSFRSSQGWLWTDLDEYASDAHCMHTTRAVFSKK